MDPSVEKYLNDLRIQREEVEKRLKDREYKKRESDEIFVSSVKKELEWLEKNKIKYELRNKKFLEEAKDIVEGYKAELAKAYQADQALNASRRKLNKFIQKNYPKIVSELKTRLFRDHDEVSKKLKSVRDGGNDMLRLNKEIRDLSEEIQAKRYELLEEEERRLRNEGSLRHYQYASNPATRPYDAPTSYGKRLSPRHEPDVSRSKVDITVSPPRGPGVLNNQSHSHISGDGNRASTLSKASNLKPSPDKDKLHPGKGVSFGGISEAPHSRETEHQVRSSYGDGKGMSSLNIQQQHQHQHQHQPQPVAKKSPRKLEEEFDARDLGRGKDTGLGGFGTGKQGGGLSGFGGSQSQAPNAMGGLKVPGKGETSPSPVKSGFGQPGGGMQKLNLSNIGAPKQQQQAAVTKPVYNQQDMEDLEEFEDF